MDNRYNDASAFPVNGTTLVTLLRHRAIHQPNQLAFTFLRDGEVEAGQLTYADLDRCSRAIATHLQAMNLVGERALLLYPPGLEYLAAFFGCLYAGVIAVPAYPPHNHRNTPRILAIVDDAEAAIALTTTSMVSKVRSLLAHQTNSRLQWLTTDDLVMDHEAKREIDHEINWQEPSIDSATIAFLQYTSGSTGTPKGVMLSHGNLLHNAAATYQLMEHSPDCTFVSWLPVYHDMGLIGGILQPLYGGFPCVLMPPAAFLQRPYRWLKAISDYRGTTSGGPNFAYELCAQKITTEQKAHLDLRSWTVAFNGAEPIHPETLKRFSTHFAACGFRPEAFYPCYGMAEATLMVSGSRKLHLPAVKSVSRSALENHQAIEVGDIKIDDLEEPSQTLVSCGQTLPQQQIVIVHPDTLTRCQPQEVGEIWVSGPSVGHGYWNRPEETKQTFQVYLADTGEGPFLRTGDLGVLQNGELYVTGRLKDLIIIRGRNLYPQDLERTAERSHPSLRTGGGAAFAIEKNQQEQLVIVQEVEFRQHPNVEEVTAAIRQAIALEYEVQVFAVVLIKAGYLPKTSSGKVQRRACRAAYLAGELAVIGENVLQADASTESDIGLECSDFRATDLLAMAATERLSALQTYLQCIIGRSLQLAPAQIHLHYTLSQFGLDSLKVFELKNRIEQDLETEVAIHELFSDWTLGQLSEQLLDRVISCAGALKCDRTTESLLEPPVDPEIEPATQKQGRIECPLSFAQQRLWLLHQLDSTGTAYHIALVVRLPGELNVSALKQSLQALMQRHDSLRTGFNVIDGQPVQVIHPIVQCELPVIEISSDQSHSAEWLAEAQVPFDLSRAPLLRTQLIRWSHHEHRLLLTIHHLIADGWSMGIWLRELQALYVAFSSGQSVSLPPLSLQYADFVRSQRVWQQGKLDASLRYWIEQLRDSPTLNLPTDFSRPIVQTFRGKRQTRVLPAPLTAALKSLSQQEGVTLFMTLLAAFNALLHRYTGQDDIVIGSPIANRTQADLEPLIGCFVNTLVLRTDLSNNPSVRTLLRRVRQVALGAYAHQDVPFEQLVKTLQPERDPSRTPLFQVMFTLQSIPGMTAGAEGWELAVEKTEPACDRSSWVWHVQEVETATAKFDLTVFVEERNTELFITLEYNTDLFKDETIDRLSGHFQTILNSIVANPDQPLSELPVLTPEELDRLHDWNQTKRHIAVPTADQNREFLCVHEWFEAQVDCTPNATAVVFGDQSLTYQALNQRSNQLAYYLRSLGVKPETLVGICLERSLELMVGLFGILKAGGAYVPLDPTYPQERLAFMLSDAQVPILLTQSSLLPTLQPLAAKQQNLTVICLDTDWAAIAQGNSVQDNPIAQDNQTNPIHRTTPDHLAYIIYTSGSTGQPKGTLIHHRGLVNYLAWCTRAYPVAHGQGAPVHSSISFDMTLTGLFAPLLVGRTVELLPEGFSLEQLSQALRDKTFGVVKVTPAQLKLLSQQMSPQDAANCTHSFIIGGEALTSEHICFWQDVAPHITLINEYGPTETVVGCCTYTVPQKQPILGSVPIGRAIDNMQLYILDRYLQPVPSGVPGELYIGGVGLARGYLHRPDLTAERFIPHPFSQEPGSRLYKTGDLARYQSDGTIEFLGRLDHQVKIRGFRIELAEIEAVLGQHPSVQACVVLARDIGSGHQELIAYVVPHALEEELLTIEALREFLSTQLPDYMIPTRFVLLKDLPLSVNGKVDRHRLPLPEALRPQLEAVYTPPQTELERTIASLWQSALGVDKVGVHDNFFDLGGHSLLLVQIHNQLQTRLQRSIPMIDLFKYSTISALAKSLNQASAGQSQFHATQERARLQRAAIRQQKPLTRDKRKTHG